MSRRWLAPEEAADLGRLDPEAIARVRAEAWPDAGERRRAARCAGLARLPDRRRRCERGPGWSDWLAALARERRVARLHGASGRRSGSPPSACRSSRRCGRTRGSTRRSPRRPRMPGGTGRRTTRWSRSCAAGSKGWARSPRARLRRRSGSSRTTSRPRSRRSRPKASPCAAASRRARPRTNGASAGCSPASTATRSSGCAPRSSRSPRATSCASCSLAARRGRCAHAGAGCASRSIVAQLEGFEAPAGAWETEILPARIAEYEPSWLDDQCLAGRIAWARLRPRNGERTAASAAPAPVRTTPITLLARRHARALGVAVAGARRGPAERRARRRSPTCIREQGASFFDELVEGTGLLRSQVEEALAELVALGLVTSDSFGGLRALLVPSDRRKPAPAGGAAAAHRCSAWRTPGAGRSRIAPGRRRPGRRPTRGGRARRAHAAAALRRRVLAPARARGRLAAAVARSAARLSPARGARRDPRRPLRRRLLRRAVRAARSGRRAARGPAQAGRAMPGSRCPAPTRSTSSAS